MQSERCSKGECRDEVDHRIEIRSAAQPLDPIALEASHRVSAVDAIGPVTIKDLVLAAESHVACQRSQSGSGRTAIELEPFWAVAALQELLRLEPLVLVVCFLPTFLCLE